MNIQDYKPIMINEILMLKNINKNKKKLSKMNIKSNIYLTIYKLILMNLMKNKYIPENDLKIY